MTTKSHHCKIKPIITYSRCQLKQCTKLHHETRLFYTFIASVRCQFATELMVAKLRLPQDMNTKYLYFLLLRLLKMKARAQDIAKTQNWFTFIE